MSKDEREPLFASERRRKILEMIETHKKVTVPQLSELFSVSAATIRNDLRELENANLLTRTHGGAIPTKTGMELDSLAKGGRSHKEKTLIGREALKLVEDGDTIALDTGTTTLQLARLLGKRRNLTVVTNDIVIARYLENFETLNVVLMGGTIRRNFHCTVGLEGIRMLEEIAVDKAFMATNSFSLLRGATTPDINQAETKRAMMKTANRVILLCDSTKFGHDSFMRFGEVTDFDVIVSDGGMSQELVKELEIKGIEVIIAKD